MLWLYDKLLSDLSEICGMNFLFNVNSLWLFHCIIPFLQLSYFHVDKWFTNFTAANQVPLYWVDILGFCCRLRIWTWVNEKKAKKIKHSSLYIIHHPINLNTVVNQGQQTKKGKELGSYNSALHDNFASSSQNFNTKTNFILT